AAAAEVDDETLPQVLRRAARHRSYVLLNLGFFVCGFHVTFIGVHLPKHLEDLGQSEQIAAWALAGIGLFNIAGSFTAGVLGQRMSKTRLLSYIYAGRALAFLGLLLLPASAATALAFSAVMGLLWLSTVPLTSGVVLGQFGLKHAGTLFGLVFLSHQIGAFIGSYGGGAVRDAAGSYTAWWWVSAALGLFAAVVHVFVDEGPADQPPTATTGEKLRRVGFRRPRLVPGVATAGAFAALTAFTVVTMDTSAEGIEARQASVVCFLHGLDDDAASIVHDAGPVAAPS
ncbi:MAG: MFS transporter, partial [Actinomycetota bacterium]|nr:MFS transporter [Actinomycetota bacterium]